MDPSRPKDQRITFILNLWHTLWHVGGALRAFASGAAERNRWIKEFKAVLKIGMVYNVIVWLGPCRGRDPDVAVGIDHCGKCQDCMQYDEHITRGIQVGTGVVEIQARQLVGKRLNQLGSHWMKIGDIRTSAVESCLMYNRRADFLDWKANLPTVATTKKFHTPRHTPIVDVCEEQANFISGRWTNSQVTTSSGFGN